MILFNILLARILAAVVVSMAISTSAGAGHRHHKHRHHTHPAETDIYLHNYGPAVTPDQPFAYYDGPISVRCNQGAASYRGQDGRPHPCN